MMQILRVFVGILLVIICTPLLAKSMVVRCSWEIKALLAVLDSVGALLIILYFR